MGAITSARNPLLKEVRRAVHDGGLTESGLCVAEGFHLLDEALSSHCHIEEVLVSEPAAAKLPPLGAVRVVTLEERLFATLAATETSQGVIALVRPPSWQLDDVLRPPALAVILDAIQDPGNAGAILRAAEAFGATGAVFLKGSVNPYHPKALRGSGGSIFRLPVVTSAELQALPAGVRLYAAMPRTGRELSECDLTAPCAIVIGNEARGIRPELAARAEGLRIPTQRVESLNAAVSAAVILYEARRQRSMEGGAAQ